MTLIQKTNFTDCMTIEDSKILTKIPDQVYSVDKRNSYSMNRNVIDRSLGRKQPYDFSETYRIIDTESFVASALRKKKTLILKEGFQFISENKDDVLYVKSRLEEMQYVTGKSFKELLEEVTSAFINNHNVFILPVRKAKSSTGNVRRVGGKKLEPLAGFYVLPETKVAIMEDEYGQVVGYKYQVTRSTVRYFKPDEILHLKFDAKPGFHLGTPPLEPLIDDILALRQIEESLERLIYKLSVPIIHAKVGTVEKPAGIDRLTGEREVDQVNQALLHMEDAGGITTSERVEFKMLGAESQALRLSGYLEYFKNRVLVGLSISDLDFGVANSTSSGSAEVVTKALKENVEMYQRKIEDFITDKIIAQILLESDPYVDEFYMEEDEKVRFRLVNDNLDDKIKIESHYINEANAYLITPDEYRVITGKRPLTKDEKEELDKISGRKAEEQAQEIAKKTAEANIAAQKAAAKATATAPTATTSTSTSTPKKVDPSKTSSTNQYTNATVKKASTESANKSVQRSTSPKSPIKDSLNIEQYVHHIYNDSPALASVVLKTAFNKLLDDHSLIHDSLEIDDFSNSLTSTLQNYIIGKTTKDSTLNIVEKLLCKKLIEIIDENV